MPDNASTLLLRDTAALWEASLTHPVVEALAGGTLPAEQFALWVQQNFHRVIGARRFLSLLIARTTDQETVQRLGGGMLALGDTLEQFQADARARGISLDTERAPTCEAYVNFLINNAVNSFELGFTVLFAAERGHLDVWRSIRSRAAPSNPHRAWIELWTTPAFAAHVSWIEAALNRHVAFWPEPSLAPLRRAFRLAARYEYLFWEMVARRETWPI